MAHWSSNEHPRSLIAAARAAARRTRRTSDGATPWTSIPWETENRPPFLKSLALVLLDVPICDFGAEASWR
eukprot:384031-Pyramimonas_sp.AAC.2